MKKILFYTLMLCLSSFALTSCNDDNDELTDAKVTYYPTLEIQGAKFVEVPIGTTYTELGCKGVLRGEDCTSGIVTSGTVDINTPGLYYINYTYTNEQGYKTSTQRTVAVCDPSITTDIAGTYTVQNGSYRDYNSGTVSEFKGYKVSVTKAAPGLFYVSDLMGGYYDQGAGYGENYAMTGYIQLLSDNTLKVLSSHIAGWGDSLDSFENGKYDSETGTITYDAAYASVMKFHVILK